MRDTAAQDVAKICGFVLLCFLAAAAFSPAVYQLGKGFALAMQHGDAGEFAGWLSEKALKADFPVYFKRTLMVTAFLLIVPLVYSLKMEVDPRKLRESRFSIYLPEIVRDRRVGQPLAKNSEWWRHLGLGLLISCAVFLLMALFLIQLGWFQWKADASSAEAAKGFGKALLPAAVIAGVEEALFRGALLGVFLRAFKPRWAIALLALLFAAVHFLQPPDGAVVDAPGEPGSGFQMLQLIGEKFLQPEPMLYGFASLFLVGLILGHARVGTASLWLPIGLHAGWVISLKTFGSIAKRHPELPEKYDFFIGETLVEGAMPLVALTVTWGILMFLVLRHKNDDSLV